MLLRQRIQILMLLAHDSHVQMCPHGRKIVSTERWRHSLQLRRSRRRRLVSTSRRRSASGSGLSAVSRWVEGWDAALAPPSVELDKLRFEPLWSVASQSIWSSSFVFTFLRTSGDEARLVPTFPPSIIVADADEVTDSVDDAAWTAWEEFLEEQSASKVGIAPSGDWPDPDGVCTDGASWLFPRKVPELERCSVTFCLCQLALKCLFVQDASFLLLGIRS